MDNVIWTTESYQPNDQYLLKIYFSDLAGAGSSQQGASLTRINSGFYGHQYNHQTREFNTKYISVDSQGNVMGVGGQLISYKRSSAAPSFSTIRLCCDYPVKSVFPMYTINIFDKFLTDEEIASWYVAVRRKYPYK